MAMTALRYEQCRGRVLGTLMWATGMCAFPPLADDVPIDLTQAGVEVSMPIEVAVGMGYDLTLRTEFGTVQARVDDTVIGGYVSGYCAGETIAPSTPAGVRARIGVPVDFHVRVVDASSHALRWQGDFESRCSQGHEGTRKWRGIGRIPLEPGSYIVTVSAPAATPQLAGTRNFLTLGPPRGK